MLMTYCCCLQDARSHDLKLPFPFSLSLSFFIQPLLQLSIVSMQPPLSYLHVFAWLSCLHKISSFTPKILTEVPWIRGCVLVWEGLESCSRRLTWTLLLTEILFVHLFHFSSLEEENIFLIFRLGKWKMFAHRSKVYIFKEKVKA